jgi:hypothetical protein
MSTNQRTAACIQLAVYFLARPNQDIPAPDLVPLGGLCSWRTRISDLRKAPYHLDIRNETRTARRADGSAYKASFYRYIPAEEGRIAS